MAFTRRITSDGYLHLTKDELYNEIVATAGEQGITIVENSDDWAIAKFLTETFDNLYNELNQIRANVSPLEATGNSLDELCLLKSVERRQANKSTVRMTINEIGDGYTFPIGSIQVGDGNGHSFTNSEEIRGGGTSTGLFTSTGTGKEQNVNSGEISEIETDPSGQITSVTNASSAGGGRDLETDDELRLRLTNTYPSVLSVVRLEQELAKIEGVSYVRVFNNYTNENPSIDQVPFKKTAIVIDDGRSDNNFTSTVSKNIWEVIRANSVTNESWHSPNGAIMLSYTHNGARLDYPVVKPSPLAVKYRVEITNSNTRSDNLKDVIFDHISSIVEIKHAGALLTGAEVLTKLFSNVRDCKEASALTVQVKKNTDTSSSWMDNYFLQLPFNQKPTLANTDVEIIYSGVSI